MTFMTQVYADSSLKPRTTVFVLPFPYLFHYSLWHFICLRESSLVACSAYAIPKERHLGFGYPAFSSGRAVHLGNTFHLLRVKKGVVVRDVGFGHLSGAS